MNTLSITNIILKMKGVAISLCFLWKLLPLNEKEFYDLSYMPIHGILCLLRYWEGINSLRNLQWLMKGR